MDAWTILFHREFVPEFEQLDHGVRLDLLANLELLRQFGPRLGRPVVDTLKGAAMTNLKELRFRSGGGAWRIAFAFDPKRRAVVLCGGDKAGISGDRFYRNLVKRAEKRFADHLREMEK